MQVKPYSNKYEIKNFNSRKHVNIFDDDYVDCLIDLINN